MHRARPRDLASTIAWAERASVDPNTIYLDTETTGLDSGAEIVDLAVISSEGRVLLDSLVRPTRPIPVDATAIHGITDEMVETARGWSDIAPHLSQLLNDASQVVIYNAEFDVRIMDQCNERHRLPRYRGNWQCAMKHYATFAGHRRRGGGFRWHSLTDAAGAFGFREAIQHRALADTRMCRAVVMGMAGYRNL